VSPEDLERLLEEHHATSRARVAALSLEEEGGGGGIPLQKNTTSTTIFHGIPLPPPPPLMEEKVMFTPKSVHDIRRIRAMGATAGGGSCTISRSINIGKSSSSSSGYDPSAAADLSRLSWLNGSSSRSDHSTHGKSSSSNNSSGESHYPRTVKELVERIRTSTTTSTTYSGRPSLTPQDLRSLHQLPTICHFYHSTPDTIRLSEVGRLLEEYRALASLCQELTHVITASSSLNTTSTTTRRR